MIEIQITVDMRRRAGERVKGFYRNPNCGGVVSDKSRVFSEGFDLHGFLGEEVFEEFLRSRGVVFERQSVLGQSDSFDFMVDGISYDVKARLYNKKDCYLLVAVDGFQDKQIDRYVLIIIDGEAGRIMGYATKDEVERAQIKNFGYVDDYAVPSSQLHPMEKW